MVGLTIFIALLGSTLISCSPVLDRFRIVGGGFASKPSQFPYQVSLGKEGYHECGGAIISDKWILTAAHCVTHAAIDLRVVVGTIFLDLGGKQYSVKRTIVHEKSAEEGKGPYDIALIELNEPLKLSENVKVINLAHNEPPTNADVVITGWGRTCTDCEGTNYLKFNRKIQKEDNEICAKVTSGIYYSGLMCLKHSTGNGVCGGDSGGPAVYDGELIGVASFAKQTCGSDQPDGYTKVPYFVDWINEKTGLKL